MKKNPIGQLLVACTLFVTYCATLTAADSNYYKKETFQYFIEGQMPKWEPLVDSMERELPRTQENELIILKHYYGLVGHYLDKKDKANATIYLDKADDLAAKLIKNDPNNAVLLGLLSNFDGYKIALSPYKAPFLASGMLSNSKKSIAAAPNDPFVMVLYANILFYMPEMIGGDKQKALSYYKNALKKMETDTAYTQDNWLYIQLLTTIGLVYEKLGEYPQAVEQFKKVLALQPDYVNVKNNYYPRLLAKLKQQPAK